MLLHHLTLEVSKLPDKPLVSEIRVELNNGTYTRQHI